MTETLKKRERIILIEDNPADAELVTEQLSNMRAERFDLTLCRTLAEAREKLQESSADLILLDLNLPDSVGFSTYEKVRAEAPETPVVVYSGTDDPELLHRCLSANASTVIRKGATSDLFVDLIQNAIVRARIEQQMVNLERLINDMSDSVLLVDDNDCILTANPSACILFSCELDVLIGAPFGMPVAEASGIHIDVPQSPKAPRIADMRVTRTYWRGVPARMVELRDVTELKEAQNALSSAEKRSRALLDHSPACHKIVDLNGNLQYMSRSGFKMLHLDEDADIFGKPYPFEFFPPSFRKEMTDLIERVKSTGKIRVMKDYACDGNHNELWLESTLIPVQDDDGKLDYITIVSADRTEQHQAESELKQFNKASVGREMRMIELKQEINALSRELGREDPYA